MMVASYMGCFFSAKVEIGSIPWWDGKSESKRKSVDGENAVENIDPLLHKFLLQDTSAR